MVLVLVLHLDLEALACPGGCGNWEVGSDQIRGTRTSGREYGDGGARINGEGEALGAIRRMR